MRTLDLHGLTHERAEFEAEDFVLLQSRDEFFECKIITGNSDKMISRITTMLDRQNFSWYIPSWNLGEIIVSY